MPLHDWSKLKGWSGLHIYWMVNICDDIKSKLPPGFRAYLGTSPIVAIDDPPGQPDVSVRHTNGGTQGTLEPNESDPFQPDWEGQVATIEADVSVYIERNGRLIAAVELVSPGNKDGSEKRSTYTSRYLGYLTNGVHLLFVEDQAVRAFAVELHQDDEVPTRQQLDGDDDRLIVDFDGRGFVLGLDRRDKCEGEAEDQELADHG